MRTVVCVGGGKVGSGAADEARQKGARVLVIDNAIDCPASSKADAVVNDANIILDAKEGTVLLFVGDGPSTLLDILERWTPDLVVPGIRGHLAAHLAVEYCRSMGRELSPSPELLVPMAMNLPPRSIVLRDDRSGVIATSHMADGGSCSKDCVQPEICPVTGAPIPRPMYETVRDALAHTTDRSFVLSTSNIGALGAMKGDDLKALLAMLDGLVDRETIGIATSCRCHAIINLFKIQ